MGVIEGLKGDYTLGASFELSKPIVLNVEGYLRYTPTIGSALVIGATIPVSGRNTGYDISIKGLRAVNGNLALPTGYNAAGCSGVEIRNMQFSNVRIGRIIAFTKAGFWGNQTNDVYALQHCQDNNIWLGDVAYCGAGFIAVSDSAANGAFQVNKVIIQNAFSNFRNIEIGASGDTDTNNNLFDIMACDNAAGGGSEVRIFGWYNDIRMGFCEGALSFETGSRYNRLWIGRLASDITITDAGMRNRIADSHGFYTPGTGTAWELVSDEAGASAGPYFDINRFSPSPAANDAIGGFRFAGRNSAGEDIAYAVVRADVPTVTDGVENGRVFFDTYVGGSYGNRAIIWQGMIIGSPTSGDKGAGTLNLQGNYYKNGLQLLTDRRTGWAAATGTATRTTFATSSVTTPQLAERVKALIDDLIAHGVIGS